MPLPLVLGYAAASPDTRWTETTCEVRNIVYDDGDGDTVYVPALRPEWHLPGGQGGPCWIPVPKTSRTIALFAPPSDARVSRWAQIGHTPRMLSVALLWISAVSLYVVRRRT